MGSRTCSSGGARSSVTDLYKRTRVCSCTEIEPVVTMEDHHPNGVRKTRRVPRSEAGFREASGYVAAIDFGTTYCSVAYALQREKEIIKLPLDGPLTRVPNAILIERKSNSVVAFGYGAQNQFAQLPKEQQKEYIYFERMKMILYRKQVNYELIP